MQLGLGLGLGAKCSVGEVNAAPVDIAWAGSHTVAEDAAFGTVVGGVLSATDPDGDTFTFSIPEATSKFAISGTSIIVAGVLDFETATSHDVVIRATDSSDNSFDEQFTITVSDVSETPPDDPLPPGDDIPDNEDNFDIPPYTVNVDGGVKLAGKKKDNGSTAKFLYDISDEPGFELEAGRVYTAHYDPDWSLMAQQGALTMVGFLFKAGNDFYIAGLRGDGSSGVHAYQVQGENLWNQTAGFVTIDDGAAAHGTKDGPNWLQIEVSADGTQITIRTSGDDGETWADEFTDEPLPFGNVSEVDQWGPGGFFNSADSGSYSINFLLWTSAPAAFQFRGATVKNSADSASLNYNGVLLTFGAEDRDTDGFHSITVNTGRLTIPAALNGRYGIVYFQLSQTGVVSGSSYNVVIFRNNDPLYAGTAALTVNNDIWAIALANCQTQPILLNTNDYFEAFLSISDPTTILEADNTSFNIMVVA